MTSVTNQTPVRAVTFDLYRDVHKGIRSELFALAEEAGRIDPGQDADRAELAGHVHSVVELLVAHAQHEELIEPTITEHLAGLAAQVEAEHETLESRIHELAALADGVAEVRGASARRETHRLYVELAAFTSSYLAHQDFEERVLMPALEAAIGVDDVMGIHRAIIGTIPPDRLARFLAVMLPAMNLDDRAELLAGMKADAPPDVFDDVWSLACSVLATADRAAVANRLDLS